MARDARANPGNKRGRYVETPEYISAARRFIRAASRRVADPGTGELDIDNLKALAGLVAEATAALDTAARRLHKSEANPGGYSWTEIGAALDPPITQQGAFQRFGRAARNGHPQTPCGGLPAAARSDIPQEAS